METSLQWLDGRSKELRDGWLQAGNGWLDVEKKLTYGWLVAIRSKNRRLHIEMSSEMPGWM
jgi:hypothetical protein